MYLFFTKKPSLFCEQILCAGDIQEMRFKALERADKSTLS